MRGEMLLFEVGRGIGGLLLGQFAQTRLGVVGVLLLLLVGIGVRMSNARLAVGAAVLFAVLMTQA